ncbi:MAG TPA: isoleucine--tRNA ligase [bacterium]|nr:isoleucine--tRNA ligase [bacterium]
MDEGTGKKDYGILLPRTDFPMKGDLARREPEMAAKWEADGLYEKLLEKRRGAEPYILHDGPPYANGNIHMGHALNKVLKDIIVRYKAFKGFFTPYVPGWDCHGMPIEHKVVDKLGSKAASMTKPEIRKLCHDYAMKYVELQKGQFKRLGIMGDWDNPYLTLARSYEDKMVDIFWELYRKGLIYKGLKPVYWCARCETALAEAEVEYHDHSSPSVYVKFKIKDGGNAGLPDDAHIVIWTTTPWTLPANVAIALHPDFDYALFEAGGEKFITAKGLIEEFLQKTGMEGYKILKEFKGAALENAKCSHPFIERESLVINADYVTLETGTGCVHIAPGHGHDDYVSSLKYKLPILTPVDSKGRFTKDYPEMEGRFVFKANADIVEMMKEKGVLLASEQVTHSYPHCWRCKSPIIFRATNQWFISMERENFRGSTLAAVSGVNWLNEWGEGRITNMISSRPDWCISRQRSWGVPIFVFACAGCGEAVVNEEIIAKVHELIKAEGSDGWFKKSADEILGGAVKCPKCASSRLEKENDIFDVWFDSGASSFAVLETRQGLSWPADLYIEGSDQYRGWFQSSLLAAVGCRGKAPYKAVISHGWVLDGRGRAMHKSLGNVVDPLDMIKKGGADIVRLWVSSEDFRADLGVSDEIMARVSDAYRRVRNTFRFMLGSLWDFEKADELPYEEMPGIDKYALDRLQELADSMEKHYENFEFYRAYRDFVNFCSSFLSSFYFDILKDRLYTFGKESKGRRSAQTVIYRLLIKLVKRIAPILVFTSDEVWGNIPEGLKDTAHVQLALWDDAPEARLPEKDVKEWETLLKVRDIAMKKIEEKRNEKLIKHPYEAAIKIKYGSEELGAVLEKFAGALPEIFIVSSVSCGLSGSGGKEWDSGLEVEAVKAEGEKCPRCWRFVDDVAAQAGVCGRCAKNM